MVGILAGIISLSYSTMKNRAHVATLQSDLTSAAELLAVDDLRNREFPSTIDEANLGNGLPKSQGVSLVYVPDSSQSSYCLQASHDNTTLHVTDKSSAPTEGECAIVPPPTPPEPEEPPLPDNCDDHNVGDPGEAGGIIIYKAAIEQSWGCYLEAAKSTSGGGWWCGSINTCDENTYTWGCRGTSVSTENGIGKGMASTSNMISACPYVTAAYAARNYNGGGKDDWYLPNRAELSEMMNFQDELNIKHGAGWLAGTYWTSEQYDVDRGRNYKTGGTAYGCWGLCWVTVHPGFTREYKNNSAFKFVRPVRTF